MSFASLPNEAPDFQPLAALVRNAFDTVAAAHACALFSKISAFIIDGKWCIQAPVCNARGCGHEWSSELQTGFFRGCVQRPLPGAYFCRTHQLENTLAPEESEVEKHKEVWAEGGLRLQYFYRGRWVLAQDVPSQHIRAYEMTLLRCRSSKHDREPVAGSCNKDDRKDVAETEVPRRKTSGILVAVTPCLQIAAVQPMYSSESVTQILFLALSLRQLFGAMAFLLYDNACGVVRHLRKQLADRTRQSLKVDAWTDLLRISWVVDRLHWHYHRACKDPENSYYVAGVNPHDHAALLGIDTEAAEQIFHVADRWQTLLSTTAPVHQDLFLLLFARERNVSHSCEGAWKRYVSAQKSGYPVCEECRPEGHEGAVGQPGPSCAAPMRRKEKRRKQAHSSCEEVVPSAAPSSPPAPVASSTQAAAPNAEGPVADKLYCEYVAVNHHTKTIHKVVLPRDVCSSCSWSFQGKATATPVAKFIPQGCFYTCGVCFTERALYRPA